MAPLDWVALVILTVVGIGLVWPEGKQRPPVTRPHRGLEMKARDGRLVHVRETESEREI